MEVLFSVRNPPIANGPTPPNVDPRQLFPGHEPGDGASAWREGLSSGEKPWQSCSFMRIGRRHLTMSIATVGVKGRVDVSPGYARCAGDRAQRWVLTS